MKKKLLVGALVAGAMVLGGCAKSKLTRDIEIETATNPKADLSGYTTYQWAAAAAVINDPEDEWTPQDLDLGAEITYLVNRELRAKGMREVAVNPDVLAVYAVGVDMKSLNVVDDPDEDEVRFEEVPKGALAVILADPQTLNVTWVGTAVADVREEPSITETKMRLDYAIRKMFEEYKD